MFPRRSLLYHRGIDDSVGTYVTDYLLVGECFILLVLLLAHLIRYRAGLDSKNAFPKSTAATLIILASFTVIALIGGLVHQFVQTVEPYRDWHDAMGWLIVWRIAGSMSGVVAFAYFMLTEHMLTIEGNIRPRRIFVNGYYVIALIYSIGIAIYSVWMIFHSTDPWSLTITFLLVSVVVGIEELVLLFVVVKHFVINPRLYEGSHESNLTIAAESLSIRVCDIINAYGQRLTELLLSVISRITITGGNSSLGSDAKVNLQCSLNNNGAKLEKRWDLIFHLLGTTLFLLGGAVQLILAKSFHCGQDSPFASQLCPLPEYFNHNSVLHMLQMLAFAAYFAAEWMVITRYKQSISEKPIKS